MREGNVSMNPLPNISSISTPPLSSSQFEQKLKKSESSPEQLSADDEENKNNNNAIDQTFTMDEDKKQNDQTKDKRDLDDDIEEDNGEEFEEDSTDDEKWEKEMEKLEEELKDKNDFYWIEKAEVVHNSPTIHNVTLTKGSYRLILKKRELNPLKGFNSQISLLSSSKQLIKKESTTIIKKFQFHIMSFEILESQAPATVSIQSIAIKHKIANAPVKMTAIIEKVDNSQPPVLSPKSSFTKMQRTLDSTNSKSKIAEKIKYLKQRGTPSPSVNSDSDDSESSSSSSDLLTDNSNIVVEEGEEIIELVDRSEIGNGEYSHRLKSGYYYVGVRNDAKIGKIKVIATLDRFDDVPITKFETEIASGELPWKTHFNVTEPQAPAKFCLKISSGSILKSKVSIKISRLPNPYSLPEILKKTEKARNFGTAFLAALLFISYFAQFVNYIFSLTVPFLSVSFREVFTVLVGYYAFKHREELKEFIRERKQSTEDNLGWFQKFDDAEGFEKLKLVKQKQDQKQKQKQIKSKKLQQL